MQVVHIYAESETAAFQSCDRGVGYVMEVVLPSGRTATKEKFTWITGTYNEVILKAFNEALSRMKEKCEIHFHTQNRYILTAIDRYLDTWQENRFRKGSGEEISSASLWEEFSGRIQGHLVQTEAGHHSYFNWMEEQMKHEFSA